VHGVFPYNIEYSDLFWSAASTLSRVVVAAIQLARTTLIVDGRLKPTERVSDARRPARTATERIAAERVSDARGSTSKGR
jgi:hypothetical protein